MHMMCTYCMYWYIAARGGFLIYQNKSVHSHHHHCPYPSYPSWTGQNQSTSPSRELCPRSRHSPHSQPTNPTNYCQVHAHLSGSISRNCLREIWQRKKAADPAFDVMHPDEVMPPGKVDFNVNMYVCFHLFMNLVGHDTHSIPSISSISGVDPQWPARDMENITSTSFPESSLPPAKLKSEKPKE